MPTVFNAIMVLQSSTLLYDDTSGLGVGLFGILNTMVETYAVRNSAFDGLRGYGSKTRPSINHNLKVVEYTEWRGILVHWWI